MWPALFGAGWIWGGLVALALLCFVAGGLGFLFAVTGKPRRTAPQDLDEAWHRYEEGDLTEAEWQHIARRTRSAGRSA